MSEAAVSLQSPFNAGVSTDGNTAGTTGTVNNRVILVGGSNITLSESKNGQYATVTIIGTSGGIFSGGVSNLSNDSGSTGMVSARIVFAGGNNITLSQSTGGNSSATITIIGAGVTGLSGGVSTGGNTAGTTGTVSGQIILVGPNVTGDGSATLSQSINGQSATISIIPRILNVGMSTQGNTAGITTMVNHSLVLVGGNNITLSAGAAGNSATITISGPNTVAQSTQSYNIIAAGTQTANTSGTVVFSNSNNISFGMSNSSVVTATVTVSAVQQLDGSSGTVVVNAGNLISVSDNVNTISIINLLSSATTVSSVSSANVVGAMASRFALEGHQHAGVGAAGVTSLGNSAGSTAVLPGQLVLVGSNNITLSESTSNNNNMTISIIGAAGGGGAAISAGTQSVNTGTVVWSNSNNVSFGMSNSSVITATATFAQSTQPAVGSLNGSSGSITIQAGTNITISNNASTISVIAPANILNSFSISGNTGTTGSSNITGGGYVIAGGSNITLSQSNASITIHAATVAGAAISAGTQSANTGTIVFSNSNSVTFGMSNSSVVTASFSQTVQPAANIAAGTQTATSGTVVFSNSNNVTFGMSNNSIVTATATFADSHNIIAAGTQTANTTGTVVFSNSNNVSFGMSNSSVVTVTFSQSVQSAVQQLDGSSGSITLVAGNLISISNTASTISIIDLLSSATTVSSVTSANIVGAMASRFALEAHQHAGVNAIGVTSLGNSAGSTAVLPGQMVLVGSNNITLSQSTSNNNNITVSIIGGANSIAISAGTQSVNTGTVVFSNSNNVSFGMTNNSIVTATATFAQSTQPAVGSLNGSSGTMSISAGNLIDISNNLNTINVINLLSSATTVSSVTSANIVGAMASRFALEGHQHAGVNAAGVTSLGNSAGSTAVLPGRFVLVGSNNVTLSQSTSNNNDITVSIMAAGGGFTGGVSNLGNTAGTTGTVNGGGGGVAFSFSAGVSTGGNTLGTTGIIVSQLVLAGGNNITLSQSTNGQSATITVIGTSGGGAAISAGTQSINTGTVVFSNSNNITFGMSNSSVITATVTFADSHNIIAAGTQTANTSGTIVFSNLNNVTFGMSNSSIVTASMSEPVLSIWNNQFESGALQTSRGIDQFFLAELDPKNAIFPGRMTVSTMYIEVSGSGNVTAAGSGSISFGIYTLNGSTLSIMNSVATTWGFSANTNNSQAITGIRFLTIHSSLWSASPTFSLGNYYIGWVYHTAGNDLNVSFLGFSYVPQGIRSGTLGVSITSGNTSMGKIPFVGVNTATTNALPATVGLGDLNKTDGNAPPSFMPHFIFMNVSSNF